MGLESVMPSRVGQAELARLEDWSQQAQDSIALADAKASTLLGWSGTALALVATVLAATAPTRLPVVAWVPAGAGVAALAGCVLVLILVIRPRLGALTGAPARDDRSFVQFARMPLSTIRSLAGDDTNRGVDPRPAVTRVRLLSRLALVKHLQLRLASTLLLTAMPLLGVAAVLAVFGGGR